MTLLDAVLSLTIVAAAGTFLVSQWLRGKSQPACHTISPAAGAATADPAVIVGASLARGLARAQGRAQK